MTSSEFTIILNNILERTKETLDKKGQEYAGEVDRFENLQYVANISGLSVPGAIFALMSKHLASIRQNLDFSTFTLAQWQEKIGDSINYLILLEAWITEQQSTVPIVATVQPANVHCKIRQYLYDNRERIVHVQELAEKVPGFCEETIEEMRQSEYYIGEHNALWGLSQKGLDLFTESSLPL